jgi:hypothetical protein
MWCIGELTAEYRRRMYDLLALYARPYEAREPGDSIAAGGGAEPRATWSDAQIAALALAYRAVVHTAEPHNVWLCNPDRPTWVGHRPAST